MMYGICYITEKWFAPNGTVAEADTNPKNGLRSHIVKGGLNVPFVTELVQVLERGIAISKREWRLIRVAIVELRGGAYIGVPPSDSRLDLFGVHPLEKVAKIQYSAVDCTLVALVLVLKRTVIHG
jgi:hypothetical protein